MKKVLLLGHTGKLGLAIAQACRESHLLVSRSSRDFDAADFAQVGRMLDEVRPDLVVNAVAFCGLDACEKDPPRALRINALYPRLLAERANDLHYSLVHFSTDAVFDGNAGHPYRESDVPRPVNLYGLTKYGGDCFVQAVCRQHFVFRPSVLFGPPGRNPQFLEKMLARVYGGENRLRIAADVVVSPSYSVDVARQVWQVVGTSQFGLYHLANAGQASLCELMTAAIEELGLDTTIEAASHRDFPATTPKGLFTPLVSEKLQPLRPWRDALRDYCADLGRQADSHRIATKG